MKETRLVDSHPVSRETRPTTGGDIALPNSPERGLDSGESWLTHGATDEARLSPQACRVCSPLTTPVECGGAPTVRTAPGACWFHVKQQAILSSPRWPPAAWQSSTAWLLAPRNSPTLAMASAARFAAAAAKCTRTRGLVYETGRGDELEPPPGPGHRHVAAIATSPPPPSPRRRQRHDSDSSSDSSHVMASSILHWCPTASPSGLETRPSTRTSGQPRCLRRESAIEVWRMPATPLPYFRRGTAFASASRPALLEGLCASRRRFHVKPERLTTLPKC
jgi:hypothetical protein